MLSLGSSLQSISSSPDGTHSGRSGAFGDRVEKDSWLPSRLSGDTYESFAARVMGQVHLERQKGKPPDMRAVLGHLEGAKFDFRFKDMLGNMVPVPAAGQSPKV